MLEPTPKQKGVGKNRKGKPHAFIQKLVKISTKATGKNEWSQPRSKYTKTIKYKTY